MEKKRKKTPRTVEEIVLDRYPHFDPEKHSILLNGKPIENLDMNTSTVPFDVVRLIPKKR
jgi:hypothetical protein